MPHSARPHVQRHAQALLQSKHTCSATHKPCCNPNTRAAPRTSLAAIQTHVQRHAQAFWCNPNTRAAPRTSLAAIQTTKPNTREHRVFTQHSLQPPSRRTHQNELQAGHPGRQTCTVCANRQLYGAVEHRIRESGDMTCGNQTWEKAPSANKQAKRINTLIRACTLPHPPTRSHTCMQMHAPTRTCTHGRSTSVCPFAPPNN